MLGRIIIGVITVVVGFLMVWKANKFAEAIGPQAWLEKIMGEGNTVGAYKLLGLIIIIVGCMIATNLVQGVLMWFFAPVFRGLGGA
jgi:hypothetical protein